MYVKLRHPHCFHCVCHDCRWMQLLMTLWFHWTHRFYRVRSCFVFPTSLCYRWRILTGCFISNMDWMHSAVLLSDFLSGAIRSVLAWRGCGSLQSKIDWCSLWWQLMETGQVESGGLLSSDWLIAPDWRRQLSLGKTQTVVFEYHSGGNSGICSSFLFIRQSWVIASFSAAVSIRLDYVTF